jgi:LCP family protein required for cell wall assembly
MKINLLDTKEDSRARRTTVIVAAVFAFIVGSLSAIGAGASYRAATYGTNVLQEVSGVFPFAQLQHLGWGESPQTTLQDPLATPDNRLNILLLGIGGEGHEGSLLTDTIIFASIDRTDNRVGLVSIPRDLAYPLDGGRFQKINAVNANLESAYPGEGTRRTSEAFAQLFTTRIDRYMRIDFKGFESLIDVLGGIDVTVEKSFTDSSFPTEDDGPTPYQWKTVSFE